MDNREIIYLKELEKLLNDNFDSDEYCLTGPKESAVCLENEGTQWVVYEKERNSKNNTKVFGNILEACLEMIHRMFYGMNVDIYIYKFIDSIPKLQVS